MGYLKIRPELNEFSNARKLAVLLALEFGVGILLFTLMANVSDLFFNEADIPLTVEADLKGLQSSSSIVFLLVAEQLCLFLIPALLYITIFRSDYDFRAGFLRIPSIPDIILVLIMSMAMIPLSYAGAEVNSLFDPEKWFPQLGEWFNKLDSEADSIFDNLTAGDGVVSFVGEMLLIALLPSLGEELFFRGTLQPLIGRLIRNSSAGVFVTAVLFSLLHLQFSGLIPRLLLGLWFGFLFLWGGSLWLPVLAHFFNNTLALVAGRLAEDPGFTYSDKGNILLMAVTASFELLLIIAGMSHFYKKNA